MAVAMGEVWETAKQAIAAYTGLSPATFFTVLALAVAFYYVISGFFAPTPAPTKRKVEFEELEPLQPPVQLGEITEEELIAFDGSDTKKPLLMAIKGQIYDVTQSRMFYGPGGPYALFAGKDASRALAKMSFEQKDLTGDISGLGPFELEALQDWEYKFMSKYVKVGSIKKTIPVTDGCSENTTTSTAPETTTEGGPEDGQAERLVDEVERLVDEAERLIDEAERSMELKEEDLAEHGAKEKEDGPAESEPKEVTN